MICEYLNALGNNGELRMRNRSCLEGPQNMNETVIPNK